MKSNKIKDSAGERIFQYVNILFMVFMIVVTFYPFWYVIVSSFSDSRMLVRFTGFLLTPQGFSLEAYKMVFRNPNIVSGYINTAIIVVAGTTLNIIMTSLGAYVLSRKEISWTRPVMLLIVFTMFFSGGLIPVFLLVNNWLNLGNTLLAVIVPGMISTWNLIIMRTSFGSIPESLIESARIDGANDFVNLFRIVIPLSLPVIAVMVLFYGVGHWNSWFNAMVYLRDRNLYPLQLILREILIQNDTRFMAGGGIDVEDVEGVAESIKYATIVVATVPILTVYPFLQKYFVKGVMIGSIKG